MASGNNLPPAQLWLGDQEILRTKIHKWLQQLLCQNNACGTCITCKQINAHQHHALLWLSPEKSYTVADLAPLLQTLTLSLEPNQFFFCVLEHADFLSPTCANRLLKPIEEPPEGYHFILLAERKSLVLPTIQSRCIIKTFTETTPSTQHRTLFRHFTQVEKTDLAAFLRDLAADTPDERSSNELLDTLVQYWTALFKQAEQEKNKKESERTQILLEQLKTASEQPPMPGSSKLFWKNLFLQFVHCNS